ncbi:inhibitor of growth protein 1 [Bacillus rossius redtenbacheri]|uniref:inhibitor of growth protein 1 n=1 Tax=Bacillus rossius redtenbacheri TaxID=93214 RepID=UPI002FDE199B
MLNQATVEALYSATYVENYLDCVENLPDDLQRYLTRMRELDVSYQAFLKEVEQHQDAAQRDTDLATKRKVLVRVQKMLIAAQEVGDEKLQVVQQIQDLIENKSRQLDLDYRNLDLGKDQENTEPNRETHHGATSTSAATGAAGGTSATPVQGERQSKRPRRARNDTVTESAGLEAATPEPKSSAGTAAVTPAATASSAAVQKKSSAGGKKKKRKSRQAAQAQAQAQRDDSPPREDELAIDPDEPTYCLCDQISYGEMILCDNDLCPIEWFHFSCVALATKPKGKWFCPKCRGDRPNVMKPKAQFLKELERYNKEKEEKA